MNNVLIDEESLKKGAIFFAAEWSYIDMVNFLLKKGLKIDIQDEKGDTLLHYAIKRRDIVFTNYLLKHGAKIILNNKNRSPLLDAYADGQAEIVKNIINFVIQKNSVNNIVQIQNLNKKIDTEKEQELKLLINDFIKCLRENYVNRNIFIRFPAKHNERAKALIVAALRCSSVSELKKLLNNQLNLFKNTPICSLSKEIIDRRWSEVIKNKPLIVKKSLFYNTLNTFVTKKLYNNVDNRNFSNIHQR